jgi:hypothetical protein
MKDIFELLVEIFQAWHDTEMMAAQISTFVLN